MPSAAIESTYSDKDDPAYAERRKEPHERKNGPWDDYELAEGARHIDHAEKIKGNKKFAEAIAKHAQGRAEEHERVAEHAKRLAKSGHISEKQMAKMGRK